MARLVYMMNCSLDEYIADEHGRFDWSMPDQQVHEFINDLARPVGTYLYGHRMYDVMKYWEQPEAINNEPSYIQDFARIWRAADKIVFSSNLETVSSQRTRIEHNFDPQAIRKLKETADGDLAIAGAELAGEAMKAGLVDEFKLFLSPVIVGGGKRLLPDHFRTKLELVDERRFGNGTAYLHYRII